jgi:acetyl esterase
MPLNTPLMQWFFSYYLRRAADGNNPYVSPLRANVVGLPSATVITAEVDPLRDEGEAYAKFLQNSGVPTTLTRYTGVTHEFFSMAAIIDKAKQAVTEAATGLKTAFGS